MFAMMYCGVVNPNLKKNNQIKPKDVIPEELEKAVKKIEAKRKSKMTIEEKVDLKEHILNNK